MIILFLVCDMYKYKNTHKNKCFFIAVLFYLPNYYLPVVLLYKYIPLGYTLPHFASLYYEYTHHSTTRLAQQFSTQNILCNLNRQLTAIQTAI